MLKQRELRQIGDELGIEFTVPHSTHNDSAFSSCSIFPDTTFLSVVIAVMNYENAVLVCDCT